MSIFSVFEAKLTAQEAKLKQLEADAYGFCVKEISAVDAAVVTTLKARFGAIFTPALWTELKTAAGQSAALVMNEAFAVLTGEETLTLGVAHFLAGVQKIGLNSGIVPSVIAQPMVTAGQAVVAAGAGAAVSAADITALKADIDRLIANGALPVGHPAVAAVAAAVTASASASASASEAPVVV